MTRAVRLVDAGSPIPATEYRFFQARIYRSDAACKSVPGGLPAEHSYKHYIPRIAAEGGILAARMAGPREASCPATTINTIPNKRNMTDIGDSP